MINIAHAQGITSPVPSSTRIATLIGGFHAKISEHLSALAPLALPVLLILGLFTRLGALGMLAMTMVIQLFVYPDAWLNAHMFWATILFAIVALGPEGSPSITSLAARQAISDDEAPTARPCCEPNKGGAQAAQCSRNQRLTSAGNQTEKDADMKPKTMIRIVVLAIAVTISGASHAADHGRATLQVAAPDDGGAVWLAASRYGHYGNSRNRYRPALPLSYQYGYGSRRYGYGSRRQYRHYGYPWHSYGRHYGYSPYYRYFGGRGFGRH